MEGKENKGGMREDFLEGIGMREFGHHAQLTVIENTSRNNLELTKGLGAPFGGWQDTSEEGLSMRGCRFLKGSVEGIFF